MMTAAFLAISPINYQRARRAFPELLFRHVKAIPAKAELIDKSNTKMPYHAIT